MRRILLLGGLCAASVAAYAMSLGVGAHLTRADFDRLSDEIALMKRGGFTSCRFDFSPRDHAKDGSYDCWDRVVDELVVAGIEPLPVVCGWPYDRANKAFLDFVRTTARRYRGKIKNWEIWNEENSEQFWQNVSARDYLDLLAKTRTVIREEIPDARIVLGGLAGVSVDYVRELYRLGAKDLFDVMNVHPYCFPYSPDETLAKELRALKAAMREFGDADKPIWMTEIGWPTHRLGVPERAVWTNGLTVARPDLKTWRAVYASPDADGTPPDEIFRRDLLARLPEGSTLTICTATPLRARLQKGEVDLVILPFTTSYAEETLDDLYGFVRTGGTMVAAGGIPFGARFRRLADGRWGKVRNRGDEWMPALRKFHLGYSAFWIDKALPENVRIVTGENLHPGDRIVPIETILDKDGKSVPLALVVKYGSELAGNLVVDGFWGVGYDSIDPVSEETQAAYLVRAAEIAAAEGVTRFYPYEFRAPEKSPSWSEDHFGILHADLSPKPAYAALTDWAAKNGLRGGFWHTMRDVDGRWWMVTPDGRKTMLLGADHVRHMGWWCEATGRKDYEAANLRKYGTREAWETNTLARMKAWGFNLLGVGSDPSLRHRGLAYTEILHLGDGFTHVGNDPTRAICPNPTGIPSTAFPNVFHPDFATWCAARAKAICTPLKDDRDLVGYFTDNELCWWGVRGGPTAGLFDTVDAFAAEHPAKIALERFVASHGGNRNIETKRGFLRLCARTYFEATAAAIRASDPNHLVLGCRFANLDGGADLCVWEEAGKVCDVVSFNCYAWADLDRNAVFFNGLAGSPRIGDVWDEVHAAANRPLMVTEWSFPALDSGLPCSNGAGQRMRTQQERAAASSLFARSLLSKPYMLGYVYFMWLDQPKEGITRAFPENSNYGLVNKDDVPYLPLVDALANVQKDGGMAAHYAEYPPERSVPPAAEVLADEARRRFVQEASQEGTVTWTRNGDSYALADGSGLVLEGKVGGEIFSAVQLRGHPVGRFTSMLCVDDGGMNWLDATRVMAVDWKADADGRTGTLSVTVEGGTGDIRFETTLAITVAANLGQFLCELKAVRNLGVKPLKVVSFFFREYPAFTPGPNMLPPADWVWKGRPGARWVDAADGFAYGADTESKAVKKFRYFTVDGHPLPDAEFVLPFSTLQPDEVAVCGGRVWMRAFVGDRSTWHGDKTREASKDL